MLYYDFIKSIDNKMNIKTYLKSKVKSIDWLFVTTILLVIFFRFFMLDARPPHHDEGINGWFADQMTMNGCYKYDPVNYHGPLHFYIVFLFQTLLGRSNFILRLPTVIVSILTIFLLTKFSRFFNRTIIYLIVFAFILSPGMNFYGRYAIHEADFLFFSILTFWGILGLYKEGKTKYLWALVLAITGLILTKETYIIHLFAYLIACLFICFVDKKFKGEEVFAKQLWTKKDLINSIVLGLVIIYLFYSGFFLYPKGFLGILETFKAWVNTGTTKGGHSKPFFYWIQLFFNYEYIATCGLLISIFFIPRLSKWSKFLAIYGCILLIVYSLISYKTPWCIISLLWPFYFIFSEFAESFLNTEWKKEVIVLLISLFIFSLYMNIKLNFISYDDKKEPYVYVHTFRDVNKFTTPLFKLTKADPVNYNLTGHIIREGEWPLPWILGDFTMVGYYKNTLKPQMADADFLLVESTRILELESQLKNKYFTRDLIMRDSQDLSRAYFNCDIFKSVFSEKNTKFIPKPILPGQGLVAEYYKNKNWSGEPLTKNQVANIDFYWEGDNRILQPPFSIIYSGMVFIPSSTSEIILESDDGGFIEIDGERIINDPGPHGVTEVKALLKGTDSWRNLKVGFYDDGGGAIVRVAWRDNKGNKTIIPAENFKND